MGNKNFVFTKTREDLSKSIKLRTFIREIFFFNLVIRKILNNFLKLVNVKLNIKKINY